MKKLIEISLLFILTVSLCSCPYSSAYNLDDVPGIYVEDILLGKWVTFIKDPVSKKEEIVYLSLSKKTDTEYNISFSGKLDAIRRYEPVSSDSLSGSAFMSTIGSRLFFNIRINARIYIAEFIFKDDKISLLPLAEHFTAKMISSSVELRHSIDFHYKTRVHPILDDDLCLRDMMKIK